MRGWDELNATFEEALRLARCNPAQAQALYNVFASCCRTPRSTERLVATFDELGIFTAELSHKQGRSNRSRDVE